MELAKNVGASTPCTFHCRLIRQWDAGVRRVTPGVAQCGIRTCLVTFCTRVVVATNAELTDTNTP
jgi:hypothetical protein